MGRGGQRGYGNAGRSAYSGGTRGAQSRAVFASTGGGRKILRVASAGFTFPTSGPGVAVQAADVYAMCGKVFHQIRPCTVGYFLFADKLYTSATDGFSAGTTSKTWQRVELVSMDTGTIYPVLHPTNGLPIQDGNPYVSAANGIWAFKHGAIPAGRYRLDAWNDVAIGGKRSPSLFAYAGTPVPGEIAKNSATPFYTQAKPTTNATSFTMDTAWAHVTDNTLTSSVVAGDSIENPTNNLNPNGLLDFGPVRSVLRDPSIAGQIVANCGNAAAQMGPTSFYKTGGTTYMSLLDLWEAWGALLGQTDKWLFKQLVWQHWRNGASGWATDVPAVMARLRAKEPAIKLILVAPDYYVQGESGPTGQTTVSADGNTSRASQTPATPDGTTVRDAYLTYGRGGASGLSSGMFDYIANEDPTNTRVWPPAGDTPGTLNAPISATASTANTDVEVLGASTIRPGDVLVIQPGDASTMTMVDVSTSPTAVTDLGGDVQRCRLSNGRVLKAHAAGVTVRGTISRDATHRTGQGLRAKVALAGMATGKAAVISSAYLD